VITVADQGEGTTSVISLAPSWSPEEASSGNDGRAT
jgi:hypothetical protein